MRIPAPLRRIRDPLAWVALGCAFIVTASAEHSLAIACGFNPWVALAVPGALDVYAIRALRAHREVIPAVLAMIAVNAASHLVAAGQLALSVPLVVGVSAIAPVVMWRVHAMRPAAQQECTAPPIAPPDCAPLPAVAPDAVPDCVPLPDVAPDAPPDDELLPDARKLDADARAASGKPVALRVLQRELRIGQRRAQALRTALAV